MSAQQQKVHSFSEFHAKIGSKSLMETVRQSKEITVDLSSKLGATAADQMISSNHSTKNNAVPSPKSSSPRDTTKYSKQTKYMKSLVYNLLVTEQRKSAALKGTRFELNESQLHDLNSEQLHSIHLLLKEFLAQPIETNIYVHAYVLFNRVFAKEHLESRRLLKALDVIEIEAIFCVCLFLSYKMLNDTDLMFLEDLSILSGYDEQSLSKLEILLVRKFFKFEIFVSRNEFIRAKTQLLETYSEIESKYGWI
jgi:hypothetical protein